jgi:hypothetical protein
LVLLVWLDIATALIGYAQPHQLNAADLPRPDEPGSLGFVECALESLLRAAAL